MGRSPDVYFHTMTRYHDTKVLAIDPGTRELGFALLEGLDLVYYGVRQVDEEDTRRGRLKRGRHVVARLTEDLDPDVVALEKTSFARGPTTGLLWMLGARIRADLRKEGVPLVRYAPNTVKKAVTGDGHASKKQVAEVVATIYPQLRFYRSGRTKRARSHHANMFDAVALGLTALQKFRELSTPGGGAA